MRYDFATTARWGWNGSPPTFETYAWYLTSVTDPHGNRISYSYNRLQDVHTVGTADVDVWPSTITWGSNTVTGAPDRYEVEFVSAPRRSDGSNGVAGAEDMEWEYSNTQYNGQLDAPHQTRKLSALRVWSKPGSTWQLMRQYNFSYDFSLYSDAYLCVTGPCSDSGGVFGPDPAYRKLTLRSITRVGNNGTNALPPTSFSYGTTRGTSKRAAGGWTAL